MKSVPSLKSGRATIAAGGVARAPVDGETEEPGGGGEDWLAKRWCLIEVARAKTKVVPEWVDCKGRERIRRIGTATSRSMEAVVGEQCRKSLAKTMPNVWRGPRRLQFKHTPRHTLGHAARHRRTELVWSRLSPLQAPCLAAAARGKVQGTEG